MKPDLYTKAVLTVIAILLSLSILRPLVVAQTAHAASQHQYRVEQFANQFGNIQKTLDDFSTKGCELVATSVVPETPPKSLSTEQIILICRNR